VTLVNLHGGLPRPVLLRGVILQAMDGRDPVKRGSQDSSGAVLYVPFSADIRDAGGAAMTFLPPLEYARCPEPEKHWTLQAEGESAGRCSFFVKGEIPEACSLAEAREKYDYVYVVAGWQLHDYGSPALRHWEVRSKVSSPYYPYGG
jgi:hypothetical protein